MASRTFEEDLRAGVRAVLDAALSPGGVVLALTDDGLDLRFEMVRDAAASVAARAHARVVLFHAPTGPLAPGGRSRLFVPPVPDAAGTARPHTGSRRSDLLLREAQAIRAMGVEVSVWLTRGCGPTAIADAVVATATDVVLLPAERERATTVCPRVDRTLAYLASRIPVPVLSVDRSGRLALVAPLGSGALAHAHRLLTPYGRRSGAGADAPGMVR